jgi:hypothetical protein
MTEEEYQQLREDCESMNKRKSKLSDVEKAALEKMKERRDAAKLLRDRIFFWEGRIKHYNFIHGNCNEISGKKELWANRIITSQAALETSRENFKKY